MRRVRIRRSRTALEEIDLIWLYLARHNLAAAERFVDRIDAALKLMADHPGAGRERDELGGARGYSARPYVLVYRLDEEGRTIDLLRVLDSRRDLAAAMGL